MKSQLLLCGSLLLTALIAQADIISLTTGTPGDANTLPQTPVSPNLHGTLINFDTTALENPSATCVVSACPSLTLQGATFSSPDGVQVIPFSTQSGPNELYDPSSDGSANLTFSLTAGVNEIGVGIADSDQTPGGAPVNITIEALGASSTILGSFTVTIPETSPNPGNAYFLISDTTPGLRGLDIITAATGQSGLAIDDVQFVPEPSSVVLLTSVGAMLFFLRKRIRG